MAKHGRGSGSGASTARGSSDMSDAKAPAVAQPAKRRRGAPQTFSSKLYKILQDAQLKQSSPVGWCLEGKSFTVHNDKDFETQVLAANYRHGKFSSFQRQLNMYGFRKVADCSDRTYSHPYFRRDRPELLAHVRRVVNDPLGSANANASLNADGVLVPVAGKPPPGGSGGDKGPQVVVPAAAAVNPKEEEGEPDRNGGGGGDERRPARKKPRRVSGVLSSSSSAAAASTSGLSFSSPGLKTKQAAASGGDGGGGGGGGGSGSGSTPRDHGNRSGPVFPYPAQRHAGATAAQHRRQHSSWSLQQHQRQHQHQQHQQHQRRLLEQEQILQAACSAAAAAGKPNPSRQQFSSSMWHQHTGRWGGETLMTVGSSSAAGSGGGGGGGGSGGSSLAEDGGAWTTTSSSAASSVDDVSSPVLLPISPADLDCSGYVPPFRLQPDASTRLPDTRRSRSSGGIVGSRLPVTVVSPAPGTFSSAAALFGAGAGRGGTGALDGWNGGVATSSGGGGAAAAGLFSRSSSSVLYPEGAKMQHLPGLFSGGVKGDNNADGVNGGGDVGRAVSSATDKSIAALSLDKAFGFGTAISHPASFDLSLDRQEGSSRNDDQLTRRAQQPEIPSTTTTTTTPGAPPPVNNNNNGVVPVTPTAVDGSAWDLACLGGPGWGSPDTCESPAASVWAAIPPLTATTDSSEQAQAPPPTASAVASSGQTWAGFGAGGAAVVEGGGNGRGVYGGGGGAHPQQYQQQQQSRMYNRNISTASVFSNAGHNAPALNGDSAGLSALDWALLGDDVADPAGSVAPAAAQSVYPDGGPAFMGGGDGGAARRASPAYPTAAAAGGAAAAGHI